MNAQIEHLYQPLHPRLRGCHRRRQAERIEETEDWEECCGMLSSGHDMAAAHMDS